MTSSFTDFIKKITHVQFAETNPGEWKKHLSIVGEKGEYNWATVFKTLGLLMGAGAAFVATGPLGIGLFAAGAAVVYGLGTNGQAAARTRAEEDMDKGIEYPKQKRKNFFKHLVRPF
jgi:hypothetical protein